MKSVAILGSTGSIGRQALEVIERFPDRFRVASLSAGSNRDLVLQQAKRYRPALVAVQDEADARILKEALGPITTRVVYGEPGLLAVAECPGANVVLSAISGTAGLLPTVAAIRSGKDIALANKETLVAAGDLVTRLAREHGVNIRPVDSEHSAVWQCLQGSSPGEVGRIILTASGGPFRKEPVDLSGVTVSMALKHPNWNMGRKITIDSATMMNKGLEVIEARWLFNVDYHRIKVVVHPQSIIHSMVEFTDGSVLAQLGLPDMKLPIQYALSYPERLAVSRPGPDFASIGQLTFEDPDLDRFPLLKMAYDAGRRGGTLPAAMNAANEMAVELFLAGKISFTGINMVVEKIMAGHRVVDEPGLDDILQADRESRESVRSLVASGMESLLTII